MVIEEIAFQAIDLKNETFRISEDLDPPALLDSIREVGQLNPILLLKQNARNIIVCGFRRVRAMKQLGMAIALARVFPEADLDSVRAFTLALRDNLSHRQMNPLENARILFKLQKDFGVPDEKVVNDYLPLLGLSPSEHVLRRHILLHQMQPILRQCLAEGRLTYTSIETISGMPRSIQDGIAMLMGRIRLSASLQKKFLGLLEDLAAAAHGPDAPLRSPEIIAILDDARLSPFQRGEKVCATLHRLRNPRLSQANDQFAAQKELLRLPGSIRIAAHPYFEEPGLHVEFDAPDVERFRTLAASLYQAAQSPDFGGLFKIGELPFSRRD